MDTEYHAQKRVTIWGAAHAAAKQGYNNAQQLYAAQREMFKKEVDANAVEGVNDFLTNVNRDLQSTLEGPTFKEEWKQEVLPVLDEYIDTILSKLDPLKDKLNNKINVYISSGVKTKEMRNRLVEQIKTYLLSEQIITLEDIQSLLSSTHNFASTDSSTLATTFGIVRRLILSKMKLNKKFGAAIDISLRSLKGMYREDLLQQLMAKYAPSLIVQQTGSFQYKGTGEQIKFDLFLGKVSGTITLQDLQDQIEQYATNIRSTINITQDMGQIDNNFVPFGGVQSKSWIVPWSKIDNNYSSNMTRLSLGNLSHLVPTGEEVHWWHAGVRNLMNNLPEAIGTNNFIFATGNQVYWTADLLAQMREHNYVAAFAMSGDELTGHAEWAIDNDA